MDTNKITAVLSGQKYGEDLQVFINWKSGNSKFAGNPEVLVISLNDFGRVVLKAKFQGFYDVERLMDNTKSILSDAYLYFCGAAKDCPRLKLSQFWARPEHDAKLLNMAFRHGVKANVDQTTENRCQVQCVPFLEVKTAMASANAEILYMSTSRVRQYLDPN